MGLSLEEMKEVETAILETYSHYENNYPNFKGSELYQFLIQVVLSERAYMIVTPSGIEYFVREVFTKDEIRDFVLNFTFGFFSRWGTNKVKFIDLVDNLSNGLSTDEEANGYIATPYPIRQNLSSFEKVKELLSANKWLVTLLLIKLFVNVVPKLTVNKSVTAASE